jgi:hypothetical protein
MKDEPLDKDFGISISEWIERTPNELEADAVGLWQVVRVGRESFLLDEDALNNFVRRSVVALVGRGGMPVRPSAQEGVFWEAQEHYGSTPEEIADAVVAEWHRSGVDPDEDGLWFALVS